MCMSVTVCCFLKASVPSWQKMAKLFTKWPATEIK